MEKSRGSGKHEIALAIGRFQPMHNGHLEAIRRLLKKYMSVRILLGSSQEKRTQRNPLTAKERKEMLKLALGTLSRRVEILELPDKFDNAKWVASVLEKKGKSEDVYTNNKLVRSLLKTYMRVHWLASGIEINSTRIRAMIKRGDARWKKWVPKEVTAFLERKKLLQEFK